MLGFILGEFFKCDSLWTQIAQKRSIFLLESNSNINSRFKRKCKTPAHRDIDRNSMKIFVFPVHVYLILVDRENTLLEAFRGEFFHWASAFSRKLLSIVTITADKQNGTH